MRAIDERIAAFIDTGEDTVPLGLAILRKALEKSLSSKLEKDYMKGELQFLL